MTRKCFFALILIQLLVLSAFGLFGKRGRTVRLRYFKSDEDNSSCESSDSEDAGDSGLKRRRNCDSQDDQAPEWPNWRHCESWGCLGDSINKDYHGVSDGGNFLDGMINPDKSNEEIPQSTELDYSSSFPDTMEQLLQLYKAIVPDDQKNGITPSDRSHDIAVETEQRSQNHKSDRGIAQGTHWIPKHISAATGKTLNGKRGKLNTSLRGKRDLVDTSGRKLEGKVREKREYIKKTPGQLKILMKEFRRYIDEKPGEQFPAEFYTNLAEKTNIPVLRVKQWISRTLFNTKNPKNKKRKNINRKPV